MFDILVDQNGEYSHGALQLSVTPIDNSGDFNFSLKISDLELDVYKKSCWFCGKDSGYLTIDDVDVTGSLRTTVNNNIVQVSVLSINTQASGSDLHQIGGLTTLLAQILGAIDNGVENAVDGFSSDLVETVGADALNNLPLNLSMQMGTTTLNINGDVNSIFNSYGGASVQLDGQSSASKPVKTIIGSLYDSQLIPDGRVSPSGTEHQAVVVVSSNIINQFYSELNRSGELDTEFDVTSHFMGWFGNEWGGDPYAAKLKIRSISSPYVSFTDSVATQQNGYATQGAGRVYLDGFEVIVEVKETRGSSYVEIGSAFVSASLGMNVSVNLESNKLVASFGSTPDHSIHEIQETQADKVNVTGITQAVSYVVNQALPEYASELGNIEIPELDGFRLNVTETWTINRVNIAFGGTVVVQ